MRLPRRLILLSLPLALLPALHVPAWAAIPAAALLKTAAPYGSGKFVFPASSAHVLDPATVNSSDHAAAIQGAINAVAYASGSKGAVIFIKSGTYYLKRTLIIRGTGVTLVGLRNLESNGTWGAYPTLNYGDDLVDADYNNRASIEEALGGTSGVPVMVDVLQHPAVVRINGNEDYGEDCDYGSHGLRGFNIRYTGTNLASAGAKATAVTLQAVYHSPVQDVTIGGGAHGPYNGIDVGTAMMPLVHNVTITNPRGEFGLRAGDSYFDSHAQKYHALTITAPVSESSATDLIVCRGESEFIGARLEGGRIGMDISGTAVNDDWRIGNITLRSVLIKNTARQGIVVNNAQAVGMTDIQIDDAGAEGIKVGDPSIPVGDDLQSGFLGGLQMLNIRINHAGYSALRVHGGMNVSVTNAVLLNSGQKRVSAPSSDLPIAGIYLDTPVTTFNVVGARIGYSDSNPPPAGKGEQWGIFWDTATGGAAPWHSPTVIATHVNFFSNLTTSLRTNPRGSLPTLAITNINGYNALYGAGYFPVPAGPRPLLEDTWALQKLPTDPQFSDTWLQVAKGYNWFDLPELRDTQWIDITSSAFSPAVVASNGEINASAFATLVNDAAVDYPQGAVFYLPAGKFSNLGTATPTFARKLYSLPAGGSRLMINKPKIQLVGSGHGVTLITVPHQTTNTNLPPLDDVIKLAAGSDGSGVFGLNVNHHNSAYKTPGDWADVIYGASFRVENTSGVRLVNVGANYGMGPCVSLVNSTDSSLYQIWTKNAVNNGRPDAALGIFRLIGTTENSTRDIRLFQVFASGLANLDPNPDPEVVGSPLVDWNDANNTLSYEELPEMDHIRIEGGVSRVRIDYGTYIQGKNGLTVAERYDLVPDQISACRLSTDHVQKAFNLLQAKDCDFLACWTNAGYKVAQVDEDVTGDIRFANMAFRGGNLEGVSLFGGGNIDLVNCHVGRTCNTTTLHPVEDRPLAGVYIGAGVDGDVTLVGGMSGWLWYRFRNEVTKAVLVTTNGNRQDWGVALGKDFPEARYFSYGLDLFGNGDVNANNPAATPGFQRGVGKQDTATSTTATWLTDAPNYP